MRQRTISFLSGALALTALASSAFAQGAGGRNTARALGPEQLERLVAPVALYPDPLLAQILPAATAPDDLQRANAFLRNNGNRATAAINRQPWNLSVRSLSYYPPLVRGMASNVNWTMQLGQAFVTQERDTLDAVQRLRARAYRNGALRSTRQQRIFVNGNVIVIYPVQTNYLYIPTYNPAFFWTPAGVTIGNTTIAYSAGYPIGPWLNLDLNWDAGEVYYHGWAPNAGGWIALYRPYVLVNGGGIYVSDGYDNSYFVNGNIIYRPAPPYGGGVSPYPVFPITPQPWRPGPETADRTFGVSHPTAGQVPHPKP